MEMNVGKACMFEGITDDRLENDFLFFVTYAKICLRKLPSDKRTLGEKWVLSLASRRAGSTKEKMLRNMHLSDLMGEMILGNLSGIYASNPPSRDQPLPPLREELVSVQPQEVPSWVRDILGKGDHTKEVQTQQDTIRHLSKDGKTYVASKELPNGRGGMGFVALSMDKKNNRDTHYDERAGSRSVKERSWRQDEFGKWRKRTDI